jgi:hypothetical protein
MPSSYYLSNSNLESEQNPSEIVVVVIDLNRIQPGVVGVVLSFCDSIHVSIMRITQFFNTSRVWLFEDFFWFLYHLGLGTMREPSYPGNIALLLIWIRMVLTQNKSSDIQRFSHLQMPTIEQY